MAEFAAMPLWTDAYLGDTKHLTTIEHGAYLLLLMTAWRSKDGMLPDDDKMLARYAGLTKGQWQRVKPILSAFFDINGGYWTQGRLTDERAAVRQNSKRASDSAKARWLKEKSSSDAAALPNECERDAPLPIPLPQDLPNGKSTPRPPDPTRVMADIWNEVLGAVLPRVVKIPNARAAKMKKRLAEDFGADIEQWRQFCQRILNAPNLIGDNNSGWTATIDWTLEPKNFIKIVEGNYDRKYGNGKSTHNNKPNPHANFLAGFGLADLE